MTITLNRLPKKYQKLVVDAYNKNNKSYVLNTLKKYKVINCGSCANWNTLSEWIKYAVENKIWDGEIL